MDRMAQPAVINPTRKITAQLLQGVSSEIQASDPVGIVETILKRASSPVEVLPAHVGILTPVLIENNTGVWKQASRAARAYQPEFTEFMTPDGVTVTPTLPGDLIKLAITLPQMYGQPMLPPKETPQQDKDDRPQQIPPLGQAALPQGMPGSTSPQQHVTPQQQANAAVQGTAPSTVPSTAQNPTQSTAQSTAQNPTQNPAQLLAPSTVQRNATVYSAAQPQSPKMPDGHQFGAVQPSTANNVANGAVQPSTANSAPQAQAPQAQSQSQSQAPAHPTLPFSHARPTGLDGPGDSRAAKLPGLPGHAATNTIDRLGGLDPRHQTVDGNNAAGLRKGVKTARAKTAAVEPLPRWKSPPRKPLDLELLARPEIQGLLTVLGCHSTEDGEIIPHPRKKETQPGEKRAMNGDRRLKRLQARRGECADCGHVLGEDALDSGAELCPGCAVNKNQKQASHYTEEGSFTHDGQEYDLPTIFARIADRQPRNADVSQLRWLLQETEPGDPARIAAADTSTPILLASDRRGRPTVVDGLHRLTKATQQGLTRLPAHDLTPTDLAAAKKAAAVNKNRKQGQEKTANPVLKLLARAVKSPFARGVRDTAAGAAAGAAVAPLLQESAGIDSDMGRTTHLIGSAITGGLAANPRFARRVFNKDTTAKTLSALHKNKSPLPVGRIPTTTKFTPFRGALTTAGVVAAPTTLAAVTDNTKQFSEGMAQSIQDNPDIVTDLPGFLKRTVVTPGMDQLNEKVLKTQLEQLQATAAAGMPQFLQTLGGGLGGSIGGGAVGYGAASLLGHALAPDDETQDYRTRRRRESIRRLLASLGTVGGGVGGMLLGQHLARDKVAAAGAATPPASPPASPSATPSATPSAGLPKPATSPATPPQPAFKPQLPPAQLPPAQLPTVPRSTAQRPWGEQARAAIRTALTPREAITRGLGGNDPVRPSPPNLDYLMQTSMDPSWPAGPAQQALQKKLHGLSVRRDAIQAAHQQGMHPEQWPVAGMELLDARLAGQDLPVRYNDQLANEIGPYVRSSEGQISMPFAFGPGADIVTQMGGYPLIMNHEHEHLRQYADKLSQNPDARNEWPNTLTSLPDYLRSADTEVPPSLADLGFLARQFRNTTGKPLDHQVELRPAYDYKTYQWPEVDPANPYAAIPAMQQGPQPVTRRVEGIGFPITHLEDWLSDQGYFDEGRSAQELIQTPEGLQMLRKLRGDGTPHADPDTLRFMDEFKPPEDWWSRPRKPPEPLR